MAFKSSGLKRLLMGSAASTGGGNSISLSNATIAENTASGQTIGTLNVVGGGTWTYSLVSGYNAGGRVAISGSALQTTSTAFDFETQSSWVIRVRATRSTPSYAAVEAEFTITVTDVLEVAPPTNSVMPVITGNPGVLSTVDPLVVSTGTWFNSPSSYTYQWRINGAAESGQTSNTYSGSAAVGDVVTCAVTATNGSGSNTVVATGKTILAYMAAPTISGSPSNYDAGATGRGFRVDSPQGVPIGYLIGLTAGATVSLSNTAGNKVQLDGTGSIVQIGSAVATAGTNFPATVKQVKAGFADTYATFTFKPSAAVPAGALTYAPRVVALGDSIFEFNSGIEPLAVNSDSAATAFSLSIVASSTAVTASNASHGYVIGDPISGTGIPAGTTIAGVSGTSLTLSAAATVTNATFKPTLTITTTNGSNVVTIPFTCNISLVGTAPIHSVLPAGTVVTAQNGKSLTLSANATATGVQSSLITWRGVVKTFRTGIGGEIIAARSRKPNFHFDSYMEPANTKSSGATPPLFWGDNHGIASDQILGATSRLVPAMARLPDIVCVAVGVNDCGTGGNATTNVTRIMALVDKIHTDYPSVRVILFGIRAVGLTQLSGNSRGLQVMKDTNAGLATAAAARTSWLQFVTLPYNNNPASGTAGSQPYGAYETGLTINYETVTAGTDDIHPGGYGAEVIAGGPISDAIQANINASVANIAITQGATSTLSAQRRFMSGNDRALTLTNGVSGTATAEWNVAQSTSTSTIAVSTEASTEFDAAGKKLVMAITHGGTGYQVMNITPVGTTITAAALSGKWVRTVFAVDVDASQAWIQALLTLYPSGQLPNSTQFEIEVRGSIYSDGTGGFRRRWFISDPFLMPAASTYLPGIAVRHLQSRVATGFVSTMKLVYFDAFEVPDPRVGPW